MNDLTERLEHLADAGVRGIELRMPPVPERNRTAVRGLALAFGTMVVVLASVVAIALVTARGGHGSVSTQPDRDQLVANSSYRVPSEGMAPTLRIGDRLAVATKFQSIRRGDVVTFTHHAKLEPGVQQVGNGILVKRVIALPGDVIVGRNGHIVLNGRVLAEPYLPSGVVTTNLAAVRVPANAYFVLGDNRPNSADSRTYGPVFRRDIKGIVLRITSRATPSGPSRTIRIPGSPR